ncbi:NAD-dependent epimerase/dehydratase family protein [Candidatus Kaiserbacteria bacterium]|nr:NAD-dependent epimerase/dehydratase family protein [Candidatus Kaiserbacteria bacterium]
MEKKTHTTLFITGAAGYVGAMLCDQFSRRDDVKTIIALDKEEKPELLANNGKIVWITANTSDDIWQKKVAGYHPSVVIHTAWQIREMYGKQDIEWKWNVEGSNKVFDFAFGTLSVTRLVYFSTASLYGAYSSNTVEHHFTEDEPMREDEYSYGIEKRQVELDLRQKWEEHNRVSVTVVRPAAITGPRGRFMRIRFGIQSALSGQLKGRGDFLYNVISLWVSFVPVTPWWVRQFVHEDDVTDIVATLAFETPKRQYDVFNLAPPGEPVLGAHMAEAVGKKTLPVAPWMVRLAYFFVWHLTRGKIPVSRGIWRFYSYPVIMDGSKLTREYHYQYQHSSRDAFYHTKGRYETFVPKKDRR